jgi:hypothetical protein
MSLVERLLHTLANQATQTGFYCLERKMKKRGGKVGNVLLLLAGGRGGKEVARIGVLWYLTIKGEIRFGKQKEKQPNFDKITIAKKKFIKKEKELSMFLCIYIHKIMICILQESGYAECRCAYYVLRYNGKRRQTCRQAIRRDTE